jgi:glycosyltransferase involved in cell wall biosynthesis
MKVLFQIRPGYEKGAAGDSVQMLKTMQYLAHRGVSVSVSTSAGENLKGYDIIHIFNVTRINEAYGFFKNAALQGKKIVVSPIFVDMGRYLGTVGAARQAAWRSANVLRREVLTGASMLLPNSQLEAQWIQKILYVDTPFRVVHNGVDSYMAEGDENKFISQYGLKDFLLCVGRLSPIKNQLGLIRAVRDLHVPLILIGPVNDYKYAKRASVKGKSKQQLISKSHHYISSDGYDIYVGKNNLQNDELTLRFASAGDLWLHTKVIPGSHVIVKSKGKDIPERTLLEAAQLAAWYSKARQSANVPVDYCPRKNVKKPGGAKPGMVIYEHYNTIYVTPSEEDIHKIPKAD